MSLFLKDSVDKLILGNQEVKSLYLGSTQIYKKESVLTLASFMTDAGGTAYTVDGVFTPTKTYESFSWTLQDFSDLVIGNEMSICFKPTSSDGNILVGSSNGRYHHYNLGRVNTYLALDYADILKEKSSLDVRYDYDYSLNKWYYYHILSDTATIRIEDEDGNILKSATGANDWTTFYRSSATSTLLYLGMGSTALRQQTSDSAASNTAGSAKVFSGSIDLTKSFVKYADNTIEYFATIS